MNLKDFVKYFYGIALILILLLTGCAHQQNVRGDDLASLQSMSSDGITPADGDIATSSSIRTKALQDIAMTLGAQGGLAWSSEQINARLQKDRWQLETVYNFNGMMLSHGVLPPVLQEGDNTLNLADPNTIRIADKTYKILQQARFATTPPNWRDYLLMHYTQPELPNRILLPRDKTEQKIWREYVKNGWDKGIEQAYSIFQQNLARLKRDYYGMILYRKLLLHKMVSPPYVSRTEMGVTGDGSNMNINDQVLRITVLPRLQTDSEHWKAIAVTENDTQNNYPYSTDEVQTQREYKSTM
ncbi:MAG: type IV secretory system conjugative DNA transfer family protein [Gammaproteobacteria bacterium]|nr:type IV secretory system conjugative DNA transfer family protein [Gammaproteobacteria bacterium]